MYLLVSLFLSSLVLLTGVAPFDLQAALDAALSNSIVSIPPGEYLGNFVIRQPLHLVGLTGPKGEAAVLDGQGQGTVLTILAPDVVVENLTIRNSGNVIEQEDGGILVESAADVQILGSRLENVLYGIRGSQANRLVLRNNYIGGKDLHVARRGDGLRLWQSEDCLVEGNTVEAVRDAIFWFSDGAIVRNNTFHNNRYGIHMMYTDGMQILNNDLHGNSVGAYLMYSLNVTINGNTFRNNRGPSGYGLALKDMDGAGVADNYFLDNRVGLFFDNSPGRVDITQAIQRNVLAYNDTGVLMMPATQRNILQGNTFLDNIDQVGIKGGGSNAGDSLGGNRWDGNYWSDYAGYDVEADGVGNQAYHAESLFENLTDRQPELRLFLFSPVEQAVDLAAQAFPIIKPKPKLSDVTPLMAPILPHTLPILDPQDQHIGWVGGFLALASLGLMALSALRMPWRTPSPHPFTQLEGKVMLSIHGLTKQYPLPGRPWWSDAKSQALDNLTLELAVGESLALWGTNGAGKTTVLKCVLGLLNCDGSLLLNGVDLRTDGRRARRFLGYVPQELAFHNDLSVADTCRLYARLKGVPVSRIAQVLELVQLNGQDQKVVGALSGGMKQRLALALALLADPPLLLLDEPTSNLDAAARTDFIQLLNSLRRSGKTLLFTSHHREEIEQLADRVAVLQDGVLVATGRVAQVTSLLNGGQNGAPVANRHSGEGIPTLSGEVAGWLPESGIASVAAD